MALPLSIFLLSASILSFEIIVIRLLAISHWQPFVTLAISTALLGFGLSGSVLIKIRQRVFPNIHISYPALTLSAVLLYRPVIHASGRLHLDPGLIIRDPIQWLKVGLLIAVLTVPFTLASGALALPLLERESVGRYYGWNFIGAGIGVILALTTLRIIEPVDFHKVPTLLAGAAFAASLFHYHRKRKVVILTGVAVLSLVTLYPSIRPVYGPYKDISYALRLPSAQVKAQGSGITGILQIVTAPALRSASGLSTRYVGDLPAQAALYRSGDRIGTMVVSNSSYLEENSYLKWQTAAAPYILMEHGFDAAIVGFDGGEESVRAIIYGSSRPLVIEPDRAVSQLIKRHPDLFKKWIYGPGRGFIVNSSARSHFSKKHARYDLIVYTAGVNLATAAAGLTSTAESYEITVQGIRAALKNLKKGGVLALTGWNQEPATGRWKLFSLLSRIKPLNEDGRFGGRVLLVTGWSNHTFLVGVEPFEREQLSKLSEFCEKRGFSLTDGDRFPGPEEAEPDVRKSWYSDLDLRPPTDSRPYPWHSLKFSYLKHLAGEAREAAFPRVEWGFFFLVMVLALTTVFALIALLVSRPGSGSSGGFSFSLYFACLGLGYMTTEILLIKRSGLAMGPPAVTAAIVLASFLLGSGLGSLVAGKLIVSGRNPRWAFPAIILSTGIAYTLIPFLLTLPPGLRAAALFLVASPTAFFMGFPFPAALMLCEANRESLVPWAWSLNGYTSVIGSSLAGILAVTMGFGILFILGATCYLTAGWVFVKWFSE